MDPVFLAEQQVGEFFEDLLDERSLCLEVEVEVELHLIHSLFNLQMQNLRMLMDEFKTLCGLHSLILHFLQEAFKLILDFVINIGDFELNYALQIIYAVKVNKQKAFSSIPICSEVLIFCGCDFSKEGFSANWSLNPYKTN